MHVASGWLTSILLALFVIASGWFTEILLVLFVLCYNQWVVPDIDTAHRVPQRNNAGNPKPLVCRFVRRLVKKSLIGKKLSMWPQLRLVYQKGLHCLWSEFTIIFHQGRKQSYSRLKKLKESSTTGADLGFFLGGGALVSRSTSTPINHIVFCGRIPVALFPTQLYAVYWQQTVAIKNLLFTYKYT